MKKNGQASLNAGARRDTVTSISSVTNKQMKKILCNLKIRKISTEKNSTDSQ